jgi:hypothetical protein
MRRRIVSISEEHNMKEIRFVLTVMIVSVQVIFSNAQMTQAQCLALLKGTNAYCGLLSYSNCFCCQGQGNSLIASTFRECKSCNAGKFMNQIQHRLPCSDCPLGKYSSQSGQSTCSSCPAFSTTAEVGSDSYIQHITLHEKQIGCLCNAGYTGGWYYEGIAFKEVLFYYNDNNLNSIWYKNGFDKARTNPSAGPAGLGCVACAAGQYKMMLGTTACIDCEASKYSGPAAKTCTQCPTGKLLHLAAVNALTVLLASSLLMR